MSLSDSSDLFKSCDDSSKKKAQLIKYHASEFENQSELLQRRQIYKENTYWKDHFI